MDALTGVDLRSSVGAVLAPLLFLTSCATLVWGLQNRYSRIVQSIRALYARWNRAATDAEREALIRQARILESRACSVRNGVVGYYVAMGSFLSTAALLALSSFFGLNLAWLIILSLLTGLLVVGATLITVLLDSLHSFDAIGEELGDH